MSILISVFSLLNGVLGMVRVNAIFPVFEKGTDGVILYMVTYCFESICFFSAIWLFSVKYYETASDLKLMLTEDLFKSSWSHLRSHKQKCKVYRWAILALLIIC